MSDWSESVLSEVPLQILDLEPQYPALIVLRDPEWPKAQSVDELAGLARDHHLNLLIPGPTSWWLDRVEPGFPGAATPLRFVGDTLVPWWRERSQGHLPLGVLGFGRGGQGALQAAYRWPREMPVVAAIAPAIDFHREYPSDPLLSEMFTTSEAARQQTATLNLHPMNWPPHQWLVCDPRDPRSDGCERLASKLRSIGIPFTAQLRTPWPTGPSSDISPQLGAAFAFLAEKLQDVITNPPSATRLR